jgi:cell division inhibitor SulA
MLNPKPRQIGLDYNDTQVAEQRIIEFVFPGEPRHQLPLILPVLTHLSNHNDQRWLTCIGALFLSKKDCQKFNLNWQRLLQVLPNNRCAVIDLAERALQAGKSHTVVSLIPATLSPQELVRLERAATLGNCQGIVIHGR